MRKTSWEFNSIAFLGDIRLCAEGQPQVVEGPRGQAVSFDGARDGLFAQANPLAGMAAFTIEIVFRPDRGGLKEQRFFHVGQAHGDRVLFETRLTADDKWYLDTFIRSKDFDCTLLNKELFHPLGAWYHLAMSCDGQQQINYVNGTQENRGPINFAPMDNTGALSVGVRLNRVCWFIGAISEMHLTAEAIGPEEFCLLQE